MSATVTATIDGITTDTNNNSSFPSSSSSASLSSSNADGNNSNNPHVTVTATVTRTNATSRGLSDVHTPTWVALLSLNISLRTLLFHPLLLAVARKRVTREETPPTTAQLLKASWRGGVINIPTGKGKSVPSSSSSSVSSGGGSGSSGAATHASASSSSSSAKPVAAATAAATGPASSSVSAASASSTSTSHNTNSSSGSNAKVAGFKATVTSSSSSSSPHAYNSYDLGKGGVRGMYRGVGAALLCNVVGEVCYLLTLETLKESLINSSKDKKKSAAAAAAGTDNIGHLLLPRSSPEGSANGNDLASSSSSFLQAEAEEVADDFTSNSLSSAIGAMAGDAATLLVVTPFVIAANKQFTAGYGMARDNVYRSMPATLRELWRQPPASGLAPLTAVIDGTASAATSAAAAGVGAGTTTAAATTAAKTGAPVASSSAAAKTAASHVNRGGQLPRWRRMLGPLGRDSFVNGVRSLYQGTSAGVLRIPSSGCWWMIYTTGKEKLYTAAAPHLEALNNRYQTDKNVSPSSSSLPSSVDGIGGGGVGATADAQTQQIVNSGSGGSTGGMVSHSDSHASVETNGAANGSKAATSTSTSSSSVGFWVRHMLLSPTDNMILNATAGIVASVVTTVIFNPLAVIQTRQQTMPSEYIRQLRREAAAEAEAKAAAKHSTTAAAAAARFNPFSRVFSSSSSPSSASSSSLSAKISAASGTNNSNNSNNNSSSSRAGQHSTVSAHHPTAPSSTSQRPPKPGALAAARRAAALPGRAFYSAWLVGRDLRRREGWRGFMKGVSANASMAVLDGVIFSLLFEMTKLGSDREVLARVAESWREGE